MKKEISPSLIVQHILAIVILLLGIFLLVFMIVVEDEFGALPLLLILSGSLWFYRMKSKIKKCNI